MQQICTSGELRPEAALELVSVEAVDKLRSRGSLLTYINVKSKYLFDSISKTMKLKKLCCKKNRKLDVIQNDFTHVGSNA